MEEKNNKEKIQKKINLFIITNELENLSKKLKIKTFVINCFGKH